MHEFSVVLPVRTTPKEVRFFERMFPHLMGLGSRDVIVVVDKPFDDTRYYRVPELAKRYGARVIGVWKDASWNFHQAHVRRVGYEAADYDTIFTMDVDEVPLRSILKGLPLVTKPGVGVVSFCKMLKWAPTFFLRNMYYYAKTRVSKFRFSGIYWLNRPIYKELMPVDEVRKIKNGEDTMLLDRIVKSKYELVMLPDIGSYCLDYGNEDLPWRQFLDGVWFAAHRSWTPQQGSIKLRSPLASMLKTVLLNRPHVTKGFIWGKDHPDDPIFLAALKSPSSWQFQYHGNISRGYAGSG